MIGIRVVAQIPAIISVNIGSCRESDSVLQNLGTTVQLLACLELGIEVHLVLVVLLLLLVDHGLQILDQGGVLEVQGLELGKVVWCDTDINIVTNNLVVGEVVETKGILIAGQSRELGIIADLDTDHTVVVESCYFGRLSRSWQRMRGGDQENRQCHDS